MNNKEKLAAIIKKAQEEGDFDTIIKVKKALYNAQVKAAEARDAPKVAPGTESYITTSKSGDAPAPRKIRTDIPRPNYFIDRGEDKNPNEKDLYVKQPVHRARSTFEMVDAVCVQCNHSAPVHPSEYAQRKEMENNQYICDKCIGKRFRR